jgi:uncharacterized membrane protein YGL010W
MRTALDQLAKYAEYHRDRRNIATHLFGVPMIMFAVVVLLSRPGLEIGGVLLNPAVLAAVAAGVYYILLDAGLGIALGLVMAAMVWGGMRMAALDTPAWLGWGIGLFVLGWIIQFIGHYYEGRKPAFVDDLIGLLIGPLFVLAEMAFLLGLRQPLERAIGARAGPTHIRPMDGETA